jgi:hypothetical protein
VINYALDIAIESTMLHAVEADSGARRPRTSLGFAAIIGMQLRGWNSHRKVYAWTGWQPVAEPARKSCGVRVYMWGQSAYLDRICTQICIF